VRDLRIGRAAKSAAAAMHRAYLPATVVEAVSEAIPVWGAGALGPAAAIAQAALATVADPADLTADRAGIGVVAEHDRTAVGARPALAVRAADLPAEEAVDFRVAVAADAAEAAVVEADVKGGVI
jgi:hypothetical protein